MGEVANRKHMFDFAGKWERLRFRAEALKPLSPDNADHDYDNVFCKSRKDIERLIPIALPDAYILVMGCGYRYPDVLLYAGCSKHVYGLDVRPQFYRDGFFRLYRYHRASGRGVPASLYKTFTERSGLRRYYARLSARSHALLRHADVNLASYGGEHVPYGDEMFDVVMSNAVLQHIMNLNVFFAESARIIKTGGLAYHVLHNYCSFSGSLFSEWYCEQHPWGHLRGIYRTNPRHLNGERIGAVAELFSRWFDVENIIPISKDHSKKDVDESFTYEGEEHLTPALKEELLQYPEEELLTRSYLIIGRKR